MSQTKPFYLSTPHNLINPPIWEIVTRNWELLQTNQKDYGHNHMTIKSYFVNKECMFSPFKECRHVYESYVSDD